MPSQTSSINDQGYLDTVNSSSYDDSLQQDTINWNSDMKSNSNSKAEEKLKIIKLKNSISLIGCQKDISRENSLV